MRKITDEFVDSVHKKMWDELRAKHEQAHKEYWKFRIPQDELNKVGEHVRALYILQKWQKEAGSPNPVSYLHNHMVNNETAKAVVAEYIGVKAAKEEQPKPEKRATKWGAFMEWAKSKDGKEFTTEQLVEQSGFSYQTTLNFVNETPEFIKVKRGLYRISIAKRPD